MISTFDRLPFTWGKIALEPDLLARNEQIGGDDSLCEQLRRAGMSSAEVQDAFGTLMDRARDGVEYIQETSAHAAQHASPIPKIVRSTKDGALRVVWRDSVFPLSVARHTFLSKCHDSICHDSSAATAAAVDKAAGGSDERSFRMRVFALLARYEALAGPKHTPGGMGGSGGGSGSQAAVPASVIHAFEQWADMPPGSCIECFASPLNHRNVFEPRQYAGAPWTQANIRELLGASPWYCSAFEDVDAPFGGGVNFFYQPAGRLEAAVSAHAQEAESSHALTFPCRNHGCGPAGVAAAGSPLASSSHLRQQHQLLLLNPPYSPQPMLRLVPALERILAAAQVRTTALVVFSSSHKQLGGLDALDESPYLVGTATLAAGEHAFVHGRNYAKSSRKVRGESLWTADFDTRLALLSNSGVHGSNNSSESSSSVTEVEASALARGEVGPSEADVRALLESVSKAWIRSLEERRAAFRGTRRERNRKGK